MDQDMTIDGMVVRTRTVKRQISPRAGQSLEFVKKQRPPVTVAATVNRQVRVEPQMVRRPQTQTQPVRQPQVRKVVRQQPLPQEIERPARRVVRARKPEAQKLKVSSGAEILASTDRAAYRPPKPRRITIEDVEDLYRLEEDEIPEADDTIEMYDDDYRPRKKVARQAQQVRQVQPKKRRAEDYAEPVRKVKKKKSAQEIFLEDEPYEKPKKKHKKLKIFLVVLFLLLIAGGAVVYFWGDKIVSRLTGGQSNLMGLIGTMVSDEVVPLKTDSNGRTNVLIFGTSGYDMGGSDHDGAFLADSIMLVSIDEKAKDVAMLSMPRDLYVGSTCTSTGKINEVYWCANQDENHEAAGANAMAEAVENVFGVDIQYKVHLDWSALIQVVDALGGITVTVDEDIADYGWTNIVMQAGVPRTLNGEDALALARARHGTVNGDFTRGTSQQKILIAIKDRIIEKGLGVSEALALVNAVGDNARTTFTIEEIKTIATVLKDFDLAAMRSLSLLDTGDGTSLITFDDFDPGYAGYAVSFVVPVAGRRNYTDIRAYVKKMLISDPVLREEAVITVLNGSEESGVASRESAALTDLGLKVGNIGDAPSSDYQGITIYDTSEDHAPGTKQLLESHYGVTALPMDQLPAGVSPYNTDFIVIIGTTPAPAAE